MGQDVRIERSSKTIDRMENVFLDEQARKRIDATTVVYAVEYWRPVAEGTEGGLYWGNSTVFAGGGWGGVFHDARPFSCQARPGRVLLDGVREWDAGADG